MIYVIMSNIFIIIFTLLAAGMSGHAPLTFLLGGGLLLSVTAGYVEDGKKKLLIAVQLFLAVLFALCAGKWWACLIFVCIVGINLRQTLLAADITFLLQIMIKIYVHNNVESSVPYMIAKSLLIFAVVNIIICLVVAVRYLIDRWEIKEEEGRRKIIKFSLNEMVEIKKNKELARQSFYIDKNARLVERENISRKIHNSVGHSITAAVMTLDAADMLFEQKPKEAHQKMLDATERIRGSLDAIRSAVRALDDEAADVSVKDLICYFDNIIDDFLMDTDRSCDRLYEIYDMQMMIPSEHAQFLTGALEEFLTNGAKHTGAKNYMVKLSGDSAHFKLEVKDDGRGEFDETNRHELIEKGFGLKKIEAYVNRCGGTTMFKNEDGFRSIIELPIQNNAEK